MPKRWSCCNVGIENILQLLGNPVQVRWLVMCSDCVGGQASVCPTVSDHLTHFHTPAWHFCLTQHLTLPPYHTYTQYLFSLVCSRQTPQSYQTHDSWSLGMFEWISAVHLNYHSRTEGHTSPQIAGWSTLHTIRFSLRHKSDETSNSYHNAVPHWGKCETLVRCTD